MIRTDQGFTLPRVISEDVLKAAREALLTSLNVQEHERVLIVANPENDLPVIAQALYNVAQVAGARPILMFQAARSRVDLTDVEVIEAMRTEPQVIISLTVESLGNDPQGLKQPYRADGKEYNHIFYYLITTGKTRAAWCPSMTLETFVRAVPIDYPLMWKRAARLEKILTEIQGLHVTTPAGTDLFVDLTDRPGMRDDGDYRKPGEGGNLPAGEVFSVPTMKSHGRVVIDGSASLLNGTLVTKTPFSMTIEKGIVTDLQGGEEADLFRASLDQMRAAIEEQHSSAVLSDEQAEIYRVNRLNLSEFGIGLNPQAVINGNMTEDEKVLDTCHIAIGDDCYGYAPSVAHLDLIMFKPTITLIDEAGRESLLDPLKTDPP